MGRLVFLLALFWPVVGSADLEAGMTAYNRGEYGTALQEWEPLAIQGNARAQMLVGKLYEHGHGVEQDYEEAA